MSVETKTSETLAKTAEATANKNAETAKSVAKTGAETAKAVAAQGEKTTKTATKRAKKNVRKAAKPKAKRKSKAARAKAQPVRNERKTQMKFDPTNMFAGFSALPGTAAFEKMFSEAAERSEETAKRSRKAAEELAEMYRSNVDALAEASRIAATGAQSIGQRIASQSRDSIEQSANTVRSFAEAKNPTELLQLQGEFARTSFDRFVEDSSALTESFVKLAGEAFQPISSRASANADKLNKIAA
jgi:phasin family protein